MGGLLWNSAALSSESHQPPYGPAPAPLDGPELPSFRYPLGALRDRVWELRENLTAYDAVYVALAEALGAPLVTCDRALARAPGTHAAIELFEA